MSPDPISANMSDAAPSSSERNSSIHNEQTGIAHDTNSEPTNDTDSDDDEEDTPDFVHTNLPMTLSLNGNLLLTNSFAQSEVKCQVLFQNL